MKKAVAHLLPFMEKERKAKEKELAQQGVEISEDVSPFIQVPVSAPGSKQNLIIEAMVFMMKSVLNNFSMFVFAHDNYSLVTWERLS